MCGTGTWTIRDKLNKTEGFSKIQKHKEIYYYDKGNISSQWGKDELLNSVGTTGKPFEIKI